MELTAENVHTILQDCLFDDEEVKDGFPEHVAGEGVMRKMGFHPGRLASHKTEIEEMCDQLPGEFKRMGGGGSSFLNACVTATGEQWGEHTNIDELLCLGTAIGKITFLMPRDQWGMLPGAMPYFVVN